MYFGNSSDPCSNATYSACDSITIGNYDIQSPELIPTCIIAGIIGINGFIQMRKQTNRTGYLSYAFTFLLFGIMMPDAMLTDCLLPHWGNPDDWPHFLIAVLDVGLTSSIGLSFGFLGLIDLGIISENSTGTIVTMVCSYLFFFGAWSYVIQNQMWSAFVILYVYVIGFSCALYCVAELIFLIKSKTTQGLIWIIIGGFAGAIGLGAIYFQGFDYWLCKHFGCYFGGDFLWFVLSDISMYCIYKWFMTRKNGNNATNTNNTINVSIHTDLITFNQ